VPAGNEVSTTTR